MSDTHIFSAGDEITKDRLNNSKANAITSGLDADKSATPIVGDTYYATDADKFYLCKVADEWTEKGGLEYIEVEPPWQTTVASSSTWEDWDLSSIVPEGTKYAEIGIMIDKNRTVGLRKKGSAVDRKLKFSMGAGTASFNNVHDPADAIMHRFSLPAFTQPRWMTWTVELDSNRKCERWADWEPGVYFTVVGCWK